MPSACGLIPMSSHSTTTCKQLQLLTTGTWAREDFHWGNLPLLYIAIQNDLHDSSYASYSASICVHLRITLYMT